jgi:hypothetical protein
MHEQRSVGATQSMLLECVQNDNQVFGSISTYICSSVARY